MAPPGQPSKPSAQQKFPDRSTVDCKLGDFLCSQNQTATWKLKVVRQNVYHNTETVIPTIPVCGSSSLFTFVSCGLGIIHVVGPFGDPLTGVIGNR